jgi:lysyl-tRNA synthetase class I
MDEIDEANQYTLVRYQNFPLPQYNVYFTLEIMIDILTYHEDDPEIAVRCRNRAADEVLFLWSNDKFRNRLELMTDWYEDMMDDGVINRHRAIDPWQDFSDSDAKNKINDEKKMAKDKLKSVLEKDKEYKEKWNNL